MPLCQRLPMRMAPLAAAVATLFLFHAHDAWALLPVSNCNDTGTGSLRAAVASAVNNDVIVIPDEMECSVISLQVGEIAIPSSVANLTITAAGTPISTGIAYPSRAIGVASGHAFRVLDHQGAGTLTLNSIMIFDGNQPSVAYGNKHYARGGCIFSKGNVVLNDSFVQGCRAYTSGTGAYGGAIFAQHDLTLNHTTLLNNTAYLPTIAAESYAGGGGAFVGGNFIADRSMILGNVVRGSETPKGIGGGIYVRGSGTLTNSTLYSNSAGFSAGGIYIGGSTTTITSSTISGNRTAGFVGGISIAKGGVHLLNTTIAFNTASSGYLVSVGYLGAGLALQSAGSQKVELQSVLISNNTYGYVTPVALDLTEIGSSTPFTIASANNLVRSVRPLTLALPTGTLSSCPLLGPLRDNGGPTWTHTLSTTSPAIDAGNNALVLQSDQRGPPYARMSGIQTDIGAFEVQQDDAIFNTSFEGCDP
jgi:hypothetical protein